MTGHDGTPWIDPAGVAGAFIHRLMINPSLPAGVRAVKYSPPNEISDARYQLLRRDSRSARAPTRTPTWQ
jgi:hypothetical protein